MTVLLCPPVLSRRQLLLGWKVESVTDERGKAEADHYRPHCCGLSVIDRHPAEGLHICVSPRLLIASSSHPCYRKRRKLGGRLYLSLVVVQVKDAVPCFVLSVGSRRILPDVRLMPVSTHDDELLFDLHHHTQSKQQCSQPQDLPFDALVLASTLR